MEFPRPLRLEDIKIAQVLLPVDLASRCRFHLLHSCIGLSTGTLDDSTSCMLAYAV